MRQENFRLKYASEYTNWLVSFIPRSLQNIITNKGDIIK